MKFFLTVLTIVVLAELSLSASIQRSHRHKHGHEPSINERRKEFLHQLRTAITGVIREAPNTPEYRKYTQEFAIVLKVFETRNEIISCKEKLNNFLITFGEIFTRMRKENKTVAEKIEALLLQFGFNFSEQNYDEDLANMAEPTSSELLEFC